MEADCSHSLLSGVIVVRTANFTEAEFTATSKPVINRLPAIFAPNAQETLDMLQRIRDLVGKPIIVTSGYRSAELNRMVGGVPTSDHQFAMAGDIVSPAYGTPLQLARFLAPRVEELGIGQLIYETTRTAQWVHVSTRLHLANRVISSINGKFIQGIHAK